MRRCHEALIAVLLGAVLSAHVQAARLVSLAPALTETLAALHACDQVVGQLGGQGVTNYCPQAPILGTATGWSEEALLATHPDAVLAWPEGMQSARLEALQQRGLVVYRYSVRHMVDVQSQIWRLGVLTGHQHEALILINNLEVEQRETARRYQFKPWLRVFYQVWPVPLMTLGQDHYVTHALALCHIHLLVPQTTLAAPSVDPEWVLDQHPDRILVPADQDIPSWWAHGHVPVRRADVARLERPGPFMLNDLPTICDKLRQ